MSARNFSLFLALRYLLPKRIFLLVITLISILGVACAIALLIVVMAVMTGFERELERKVIGFEPHVIVTNSGVLEDWAGLMKKAEAIKDVKAVAPFVQGPVIVEFQGRRMAPKIRGVDPEMEEKVVAMRPFIIAGQYDLDGDKAILGSDLARTLGAGVGDTISVFSPGNLQGVLEEIDRMEKEGNKADASVLKQMILPTDLEVSGIFESGRYLYDSDYLLVPLHIGQELYNLGGAVHGLAIKAEDPYHARQVKEELDEILEPPAYALTWIDLNKQMFDAIRTERNVMFIILTIAIVVAAFCIMNTQITTTVQKTRDIGVMKALGARSSQIIGIFFIQGIIIGVFGTIFGLGFGIGIVLVRNDFSHFLANVFGLEVFPRAIYQFSEIPAEIVPRDVAIICGSAFVICSLAALIPAWVASRLDPVKALRYE
jgi:lipoprotein-releasing system permease protein